jgi:hypothetical protein
MSKATRRSWAMACAGIVALTGLGIFLHGLWLAWRPGAWMVGGLLIATFAVFVAYDSFREMLIESRK